jgi:glycosyltransferase involved in cell wall biosynthesis
MIEGAQQHVAILLPDLRPGGAECLHLQLADEWLKRGISVDFVLRKARGELLAQVPAGVRVIDLRADRVRNAIGPLTSYLKTEQPDALLAAMWPLTFIAPLAARLAGYRGRVAVSEHSPLSHAYAGKGWPHRLALRLTSRIGYAIAGARIGVSSGVADDMAMLSRLPRDRFSVVHNPAATGKAGTHPRPQALAAVARPVILSVGTLKAVKRHDLLIEAFAKFAAGHEATLCILGEGAMRGALEAQVERLGLQGRVLLPGYVADPTPWYAHADLFVLSSDYEGFGNVIVEAMEQGVPIVSTDCPVGPAEILQGGRFGKLVPVGDADALAEAMEQVLSGSVDRDGLRERARDFDVGRVAQRYLELLLPKRGAAA